MELSKASPSGQPRKLHVARAEMSLALPDHLPLRLVPVKPDPLEAVAGAMADVQSEFGERADIVLDLVPVPAGAVLRRRRRLEADARRHDPRADASPAGRILREVSAELRGRAATPPDRLRQRPLTIRELNLAVGKFHRESTEPVFALQMLLRTCSSDPARAKALLQQMIAALENWTGQNHLRPTGLNLGLTRVSADSWLYRRSFDRRFASGAFAPRRKRWVTGEEIGGLVKPPTRHNNAPNIARSGGVVPPPPANLPTYTGQADLLPLGWVTKPGGGERLAGLPLDSLLFGLFLGKSGFGKTEMSLVQAIALAYTGNGVLFLDPHGDGWKRARPYLTHPSVADRVWEIDLTTDEKLDEMVGSWNPLSMEGRTEEQIPKIVDSIVTGFSAAQNWNDASSRAKTILTRAVETLAYLSLRMAQANTPDLMPTVFQIRQILTDDEWREAVVAKVNRQSLTSFWEQIFPNYPNDAIPIVTNLIERLDSSNALKAFLGSSRSTYDIRRAMDEQKVVFVCPAGTGDTDRIVSCLLMYDLFRAGLGRRSVPVEGRLPFYTFIDELTAIDGASKGTLAAITEQLRKYQVKLLAMTQMAQRLTPTTRQGLLQNLSVLSTTASDVDEAQMVVRRWGKHVEPDTIVRLQKYHYVMNVTLADESTMPFRVRGASVEEMYGKYYGPGGEEELTQRVNTNLRRRPAREVLASLEVLDAGILQACGGGQMDSTTPKEAGPAGERSRASGGSTELIHHGDTPGGKGPDAGPADDDVQSDIR